MSIERTMTEREKNVLAACTMASAGWVGLVLSPAEEARPDPAHPPAARSVPEVLADPRVENARGLSRAEVYRTLHEANLGAWSRARAMEQPIVGDEVQHRGGVDETRQAHAAETSLAAGTPTARSLWRSQSSNPFSVDFIDQPNGVGKLDRIFDEVAVQVNQSEASGGRARQADVDIRNLRGGSAAAQAAVADAPTGGGLSVAALVQGVVSVVSSGSNSHKLIAADAPAAAVGSNSSVGGSGKGELSRHGGAPLALDFSNEPMIIAPSALGRTSPPADFSKVKLPPSEVTQSFTLGDAFTLAQEAAVHLRFRDATIVGVSGGARDLPSDDWSRAGNAAGRTGADGVVVSLEGGGFNADWQVNMFGMSNNAGSQKNSASGINEMLDSSLFEVAGSASLLEGKICRSTIEPDGSSIEVCVGGSVGSVQSEVGLGMAKFSAGLRLQLGELEGSFVQMGAPLCSENGLSRHGYAVEGSVGAGWGLNGGATKGFNAGFFGFGFALRREFIPWDSLPGGLDNRGIFCPKERMILELPVSPDLPPRLVR